MFVDVLKAYITLLIQDQQTDLVASYVSQLPADLATVQYATFLETVTQPELRPRCLHLATDAGEMETFDAARRLWPHDKLTGCFVFAGLDVAAVTKLVVETVRERDDAEFTHHSQTLEMGTTKVPGFFSVLNRVD